ncbi:MAG: ribosomal-processing cysteine protease Prp [Lutisporaceae bacterium]|jgi:uncharacterized protein YsxB (DUF464 family)
MIKIVIYKAKEGRIKGFKISGHSGYGIRGTDIVCSAVSALGQTAILGLLKVAEVKVDYRIDEGYLTCSITDAESDKKRIMCEAILETIYTGFKSIEESYTRHIDIVEEEV